ncbi:MAG TPA: hypothetical protein VF498_08420 [Anaerolineales bacterium]
MTEQVECYSGSEYAERPAALYWQDRRLEVVRVLESRRTPQGKYFRVLADENLVFELFYFEDRDEWMVQPA